jgi:hypothetical protein
MHWLLDANNLFHLIPEILWQVRERRPLALAALLKACRNEKKLKMTLFFDGGETAFTTSLDGIPARFAGPQKSADQIILEYIKARAGGSGLVLVSNDAALGQSAARLGAQVVRAGLFLQKLNGGSPPEGEEPARQDFSTRKKGPTRRLPKSRRRQNKLLVKL